MNVYTIISMTYIQLIQPPSKQSRVAESICIITQSRYMYILLNLYKSLVRLHLEYSVSAWSPHYIKDKELVTGKSTAPIHKKVARIN